MRFFEVVLSGAALISAAFAVEFNSWPESVEAGETYTLTYSPAGAATTIILRKGPSDNLDTLETLTTNAVSGEFEWTPSASLANGADYAFEIRQAGAEPNYSGQFSLSGGSAASSSAASSSVASSTAAPTASESSSAGYSTAESSSAESTAVSTTISTSVTAAPSASGSIIPSHGANSTISTGSPSSTGTDGPSSTNNEPPVENTGAASSFGVNAGALFGAIAAFAYLA